MEQNAFYLNHIVPILRLEPIELKLFQKRIFSGTQQYSWISLCKYLKRTYFKTPICGALFSYSDATVYNYLKQAFISASDYTEIELRTTQSKCS